MSGDRQRGRSARAQRRIAERQGDAGDFAAYFKERIYATFTGLAIILVVAGTGHPSAEHALLALVLGVVGITVAGFASDVVSHLAVHQELPGRKEVVVLTQIAFGALGTLITPVIFLALAWLDVLGLEAALRVATIIYIVTLGVIGWMAVRRSRLQWWKQLLVLLALLGLGLVVVLLQTLAHSV